MQEKLTGKKGWFRNNIVYGYDIENRKKAEKINKKE